jgi:hypothetical protein
MFRQENAIERRFDFEQTIFIRSRVYMHHGAATDGANPQRLSGIVSRAKKQFDSLRLLRWARFRVKVSHQRTFIRAEIALTGK